MNSVELSHSSSGDGDKMAEEINLDDLSVVRGGYERFFNEDDDFKFCKSAIITVQRKEQITTHFGPLATKNKIKFSLSQEQIVNGVNHFRSDIRRSQSINIQRTAISSPQYLRRDQSLNFSYRSGLRPSMIPIKIRDPLRNTTNGQGTQSILTRGMSVTNERENFNSLPLPMIQSVDTAFDSGRFLDIRSLLPDKYKCGICMHALNDPRVLDCLHTFCLECLYNIENTNINNTRNGQTKSTKMNLMEHSDSRESNEIDTNHSELTNELKEHNRKCSKSSISSLSTNPIRKLFSTAQKKRSEERKVMVS